MTAIEKAIERIKKLHNSDKWSYSPEYFEGLKDALAMLKEEAEKEKQEKDCDNCENYSFKDESCHLFLRNCKYDRALKDRFESREI